MAKGNELRMPFAEWLYRMAEAGVPYQARALAVYSVAFKATSNEELARLVGMDTKGLADKTYNKWKRYLSNEGWVIVRQVTIGRVTTIEVDPAFKETPVTFTDLARRSTRKFSGSSPVPITDVPAVESTDEIGRNYGPEEQITDTSAVKITDEPSQDALADAPACARDTTRATKESPSEIVIPKKNLPSTTATVEQVSSGGDSRSGDYLDALNGTAIDLVSFISKHAGVDQTVARQMLATNIKVFSADAMMEAFVVTTTEMATGIIGKPYKYLIETARNLKTKTAARVNSGSGAEDRRGRMRRHLEEAAAKYQQKGTRQ